MATGLAIAAAGAAGLMYHQGEKQKEYLKKQREFEKQNQAKAEARAAMESAKQAKAGQISEMQSRTDRAVSTEKVAERAQRQGKKSLLTGTEYGLDFQTIK